MFNAFIEQFTQLLLNISIFDLPSDNLDSGPYWTLPSVIKEYVAFKWLFLAVYYRYVCTEGQVQIIRYHSK